MPYRGERPSRGPVGLGLGLKNSVWGLGAAPNRPSCVARGRGAPVCAFQGCVRTALCGQVWGQGAHCARGGPARPVLASVASVSSEEGVAGGRWR